MTLAFLNGTTPEMTDSANVKLSTFFGSKRIGTYDRLGTAKFDQQNGGAMSFYPYGEDRGTVQPNDSLKFATYTRDSAIGLDYADQRYYASNFGRFMSPDPARSASRTDPQSWNRYRYGLGDPANNSDPTGLCSYDQFGSYFDDDEHPNLAFSGPCSQSLDGDPIGGDNSYITRAYDIEMNNGVLWINGMPISEASLQEDFAAEIGIMSLLRSLVGSFPALKQLRRSCPENQFGRSANQLAAWPPRRSLEGIYRSDSQGSTQ